MKGFVSRKDSSLRGKHLLIANQGKNSSEVNGAWQRT
jgi:hypothetical protein